MLKLINIKIVNNYIEADYIPESSDLICHISLNIDTHHYEAEALEQYGETYPRMAANGLIRTINELKSGSRNVLPKERLVMWY